jgi:4-amino-4-deoxy-L-arabinose transferase-like glycosyltransferase
MTAAGALSGAVFVLVVYAARPTLTLEMDQPLPRRFASGFYDGERAGEVTFAWTSQRAEIKLTGLNRRVAWMCSVRLRGGRSDPLTQPSVDLSVDGITGATAKATNDFQDISVMVPVRAAAGAVVTISSSATLIPGPSDSRGLGVQIDRITCMPSTHPAIAPATTVGNAAVSGAIFGAAFVLAGTGLVFALPGVLLLTALQALPFAAGSAPYTNFSDTMVWFAAWIAAAIAALLTAGHRWHSARVDAAARFVVSFSGAALYLKLLGLLHPSKALVDAVFHAHRLEWVLSGRYYFTQSMPGGVSFPYAIGLYVFAAPWTWFTHDHVALLRVIVCSAQAVSGALLYPVVVKAWRDRTAAVSAVVLCSVVPLPYGLVGNANLTNTFAEAAALTAVLIASLLPGGGQVLPLLAFFLVSSLAFLSHVSTFALLGVTLVTLATLYRVRGGATERRLAWSIGLATIIAAVLAVLLYYGHFGDVYKNALRVRADAAPAQSQTTPATPADPAPGQSPTLGTRVTNAVRFAVGMIGWPILVLSIVGVWRSVVDRSYDRATLALIAWTVACVVFLAVAVIRVDAPFQRYAAEFFGRVLLATFPAAVLLAARATGWARKQGVPIRLASAFLVACAVVSGLQNWMGWFL